MRYLWRSSICLAIISIASLIASTPNRLESQTLEWSQLDHPPMYAFDSIAAISVSGDTVFITAIDDPFFPGISVSIDRGTNWAHRNQGVLSTSRIRVIDGSGPSVVVVTTKGIYASSDAGAQWVSGGLGLPQEAAPRSLARTGRRLLLGVTTGVFRSTDNGVNWHNASTGITVPAGGTVTAIAYGDGPGEGVAYLGIGDSSSELSTELVSTLQGSLYHSTDGGESWIAIPLPSDPNYGGGVRVSALYARGGMLFCAVRTRLLGVVPVSLLFSTTNNGSTWTPRNTGLPNGAGPQPGIHHVAGNAGALFCTVNAALYRSTDNGANWSDVTPTDPGFRTSRTTALAVNGQNVYVGTTAEGLRVSTNAGASWRVQGTGAGGGAFRQEGASIFAGMAPLGDSLVCWALVDRRAPGHYSKSALPLARTPTGWVSLPMPDSSNWEAFWRDATARTEATATARNYVFSSVNPESMDTFAFTRYSPAESSWRLVRLPIPNLRDSEFVSCRRLVGTADYLFAYIYGAVWGSSEVTYRFYFSSDQGSTWNPADSNHLYEAQDEAYLYRGSVGAIRRATSPTATPEYLSSGLPSGEIITVLAIHEGALYALVDSSRLVTSLDHGETWARIDEGLSAGLQIVQLVATPSLLALRTSTGEVWVRARNGSVWRRSDGFKSASYPYAGQIARCGNLIIVNPVAGAPSGPDPVSGPSGGLHALVPTGLMQAPKITGLRDTTTAKGTPVVLPIDVVDDTPATMHIHAVASDTGLIRTVSVAGSGGSQLLTISPAADRIGSTTVAVIADDGLFVDTARCVVTVTESGASVGMSDDILELTARPNPARDQCDIALRSPVTGTLRIQLFDPTGALVMERSFGVAAGQSLSAQLDLRNLPPGLYRLRGFAGRYMSAAIVVCRP